EHDQPPRRVSGQHQFDGVGEVVDVHGERSRLGLRDNRAKLGERRTRLQRNRHRLKLDQSQVDDRVADTCEAQDGDAIAVAYRIRWIACQGGRYATDAVPHFAVGDGVESRQQLRGRAAGPTVGVEVHRALTECGPVRVALHDG